jgi:hypothetical protein
VFTHAGSYRLIYAVGFTAENGRERMANTKHFGALAAAAGALVAMGLVLLIMLVVVEVGPAEAAFPGQNGKIAYSGSDGQDLEIYTIDPGGGEKFKVTNSTGPAYGPSYSPDGQKIAYAGRDALTPNADYEIYTINASGAGRSLLGLPLNKPVRLTNNTTHDRSPSWGKWSR